ncbi:MAG: HAMP domain-containing protein [Planctomycetota bacterium]
MPGSRLGGSSIRRSESNDVTMATAVEITTHRPTADTSSHLPVAQQDTSASHYTKPRTFGFYLKLLSAIWLISSLGTFVAIAIISEHAFQEQMASLKQTMRTTVHAISMTIDGEVHQRIAASEDMQSRTYLEMLDHLQQFQRINPDIQRIYTMAPTEKTATHGILAYVCDPYLEFDVNGNGFIDPEEERKAIGDELRAREHDPRLLLGLEQVTTAADIVHNQWGAVLSAYAPIRNELGKSVGVLVIDISGHKIVAMLTDNRQRAWFVLGISLLAFLAAAGLVAQRLNRPIAELKRGILSAANGTYDTKVAINGRNEFRDLADCINRMLALLRERDILRRAFEHYVAREMHEQISGQQKSASDSDERNRQVQLFCAVQRSRSKPIPENLEHDLANLISLVFDFGGVASQQMDGGILVTFNTIRADLNIEEQAIRAALAIQQCASQQDMEHVHLYIGIHRGRDRRTLTAIARAGRQLAADILISDDTFHPARLMFYADRYSDVKLDTGRTMSLFAIKGAVSG